MTKAKRFMGVRRKSRSASLNTFDKSWTIVEKGAVGLFRWATTDHTGFSKALQNMPPMGIGDTFKYILMQFLCVVVASVVTGVSAFVLIAFVLPFLLSVIFS